MEEEVIHIKEVVEGAELPGSEEVRNVMKKKSTTRTSCKIHIRLFQSFHRYLNF